MDLLDVKLLDSREKSYKMFSYYLSQIKENWFENHGKYYAIINKSYQKIKFNSLFKQFLPNPSGIKHLTLIFKYDWNLTHEERFIEYISKLSRQTLVSIVISSNNSQLSKFKDILSQLSIVSIKCSSIPKNKYSKRISTVESFIAESMKKSWFRTFQFHTLIFSNYLTESKKKEIIKYLESENQLTYTPA